MKQDISDLKEKFNEEAWGLFKSYIKNLERQLDKSDIDKETSTTILS